MGKDVGCMGNTIRVCLYFVNGIFLIMGLVIFITAAVLKWSDLLTDLDIAELTQLAAIGSINSVSIFLMVLGGFAILVSLFGILGAKFLNRFFLIIYEIIVLIMFLAHGIALLVLIFSATTITNEYTAFLNKTVTELKSSDDKGCELVLTLSNLFDCCGGFDGPNDFRNKTLAKSCCKLDKNNMTSNQGCASKSVDYITDKSVELLIIPSGVILAVELLAIVMIPFLIGKAGQKSQYN